MGGAAILFQIRSAEFLEAQKMPATLFGEAPPGHRQDASHQVLHRATKHPQVKPRKYLYRTNRIDLAARITADKHRAAK